MSKTKRQYPPFHSALSVQELYPEATHKIKFVETYSSYFYKTGVTVYKIKKNTQESESTAVKEAYCREEYRIGKRLNEDLYLDVIPITVEDTTYTLGGTGKVVTYALKMQDLNERNFLAFLLETQKANPTSIGRIAKKLAAFHELQIAEDKEAINAGRPDHFHTLFDQKLYQLKSYLDASMSQPLVEMIRHPIDKMVTEKRRLFSRRIKKNRIVHTHGAFSPDHIYVKSQDVYCISPQETQRKQCILDVADDVATLTVELARLKKEDLQEIFVKRYITASKDRELLKILPVYQTYIALKQGVKACEQLTENEEERAKLGHVAAEYLNLAVQFSRQVSLD
ncbi:hypothetical protein WDW89_07625 [Deltaproteobacteria bacterium TL4]